MFDAEGTPIKLRAEDCPLVPVEVAPLPATVSEPPALDSPVPVAVAAVREVYNVKGVDNIPLLVTLTRCERVILVVARHVVVVWQFDEAETRRGYGGGATNVAGID
jgi:hypothetical protein